MVASHPKDQSEDDLNYVCSYVQYTKEAQTLKTMFIKMIMDVDGIPKPADEVVITNLSYGDEANDIMNHKVYSDSDERDSDLSGDEFTPGSGSDSDNTLDSGSGGVTEPDRSKTALKSGGDGVVALGLGGDEVVALGSGVEEVASVSGSEEAASESGSKEAALESGTHT